MKRKDEEIQLDVNKKAKPDKDEAYNTSNYKENDSATSSSEKNISDPISNELSKIYKIIDQISDRLFEEIADQETDTRYIDLFQAAEFSLNLIKNNTQKNNSSEMAEIIKTLSEGYKKYADIDDNPNFSDPDDEAFSSDNSTDLSGSDDEVSPYIIHYLGSGGS